MNDWKAWIELLAVNGLGPRHWHKLLSVLGTPQAILDADIRQLKQIIPERIAQAIAHRPTAQEVLEKTEAWLKNDSSPAENNRFILTWADANYPSALLSLTDPPPVIFYHGRLALLESAKLAVVGGRNATPQGCRDAEAWAETLASQNFTIVSGLAQGIDAAAHRGALRSAGSTIAVIATGIDRVYPSQHRELAHQIAENGGILTEFPLGTQAKPGHFPRRNRIISGLSQGCLVVEAALKSGSLITARMAAEQGREVFAIPGSVHSPLSKGCHQLIKEGAKLVESAEDILEELRGVRSIELMLPLEESSPIDGKKQSLPHKPTIESPDLLKVWEALGYEPVDIDTLGIRTGFDIDNLNSYLLELELEGHVISIQGGRYQRLP